VGELEEAQTDGEVQAAAHDQNQHTHAPDRAVQLTDKVVKSFHKTFSLSFLFGAAEHHTGASRILCLCTLRQNEQSKNTRDLTLVVIIANCYENVKVNIVLYHILFFHVAAIE
jgi:hypothetical protein